MKVYVDKGKLESHDIQSITDLGGKEFQQVRMWFEDTDNVEIVSLADYTKQVRKEVVQEIRKYGAINYPYNPVTNSPRAIFMIALEDLERIEQGETK